MAQKGRFPPLLEALGWRQPEESFVGLLNEPLPTSIIQQQRHALAPSQVCSDPSGHRGCKQRGKWDAEQGQKVVMCTYARSFLKG